VAEVYDVDVCGGHAANGDYHHHFSSGCLGKLVNDEGTDHSPIYGYAADGYAIYGPWYSDGVLAKSSWAVRDYDDASSATGCGTAGVRDCVLVDEFDVVTVLKLREKITQGEWVFIAGDRIPVTGHQRITSINFLGRKAQLPIGPYYLAHALACPVNLIFSYRHNTASTQKIKLEVIRFSEKIFLPRKSRDADLLNYAQQFAIEIEKQCKQAPFQWFNFYDFWATIKPTPSNIR